MELSVQKRGRPKGYYFLTPVWGESYTRLFIDTAIPAQLAPDNLPVFRDFPDSRYVIFTTRADAETIRNSPIYAQLSSCITVNFHIIELTSKPPHDLMSDCHKMGIGLAEENDCAALFLNPDLVFANGSFKTVLRLAQADTDVILVPGIRTLKQGVVRALQPYAPADAPLAISPRELMRIALDNLHPLGDSSWWEEALDSDLIPANLYWRAGKEGIVARCFHLHPLMVYAQKKNVKFFGTVDDDYVAATCPDASHDYVVTDSDELLTIELSNPGRAFQTGFRKESIDDCVVWAEQFTSSRHRFFFDAVVTMHTGTTDAEAWETARQKANVVAETIKARLAIPTRHLIKTRSPALKRRLIRWTQDNELRRVNAMPSSITPLHTRTPLTLGIYRVLNILSAELPKLTLSVCSFTLTCYFRLMRKLAAVYRQLKLLAFGPPFDSYFWTWNWHYLTRLRQQFERNIPSNRGETLIITFDPSRSCAAHLLDNNATYGIFVNEGGSIRLVNQKNSDLLAPNLYDTVIVDRGLPFIAQCENAVDELARVMTSTGKLILHANQVVNPADGQESEIYATTAAIARLLSPKFRVSSQVRIGSFAMSLLYQLVNWAKLERARLRIPFIFMALDLLVLLPLNIALALGINLLIPILALADTSDRGYISSLTIATKKE